MIEMNTHPLNPGAASSSQRTRVIRTGLAVGDNKLTNLI
jgi:hypothetical protein